MMNIGDLSVSANIGIGCALLYAMFAMHRRASTGEWPVPRKHTVYMVLCGCFALWSGANFINGVLAGELMNAAFDGISAIGFAVLGVDRVRVALGKGSLFQRQPAALSK
jgi:hypothetical protein